MKELIKCPCCRKVRAHYRAGFCSSCYRNFIDISYEPNPKLSPRKEVHKKICADLINDYHKDKKQMAKEYGCTVININRVARRYLQKVYTIKILEGV